MGRNAPNSGKPALQHERAWAHLLQPPGSHQKCNPRAAHAAHAAAVLAKRSFPPPPTARMVEAGYRDAPDVESDMAIVFVKVRVW